MGDQGERAKANSSSTSGYGRRSARLPKKRGNIGVGTLVLQVTAPESGNGTRQIKDADM